MLGSVGSANELVEKIGLGEDTFLEYKKPEYELIGGAELRLTIFAADARAEP